MKNLLLPQLAAIALITAVNAEVAKYHLLMKWKENSWTIPMETKTLCEALGQKILNQKNNWERKGEFPYYICVKAK